MSDNPLSRTSHARTLDLEQQSSSLDRAPSLKPEFDRAKAETSPQQALQPPKAEIGGPQLMGYAPAPGLALKPQGEIRQVVDRQVDQEKRRQLAERSRALVEKFKTAREREKQKGLEERGL